LKLKIKNENDNAKTFFREGFLNSILVLKTLKLKLAFNVSNLYFFGVG
jgi:hypothetical protein